MSLLLLLLILVPVVGAVGCLLVPARMARYVALLTSLVELVLVLPLAGAAFGGEEVVYAPAGMMVEGLRTGLRLGMDAVSWWLVLLTAALTPLSVVGSFAGINRQEKSYYFWLTILVSAMVGTFLARDGLLFYVFFELTLIPMFFLIGIWGGEEREWAAKKFFLYTFVGSVFTLGGILFLGFRAGNFAFDEMLRAGQAISDPGLKVVLFLALLAGFAVKVPLFPVHTWLPLAHTVAPTAGSVILAGVLLKLGTYGLLKIAIPMGLLSSTAVAAAGPDGLLPVMAGSVIPVLGWLCVVGIIYGALVAWVQEDVKKLVAYSSVSHLGFCVLGLLALNSTGMQGSVFYMINHGISTGALFLMIGMIYDRYHTRMFRDYGGLGRVMPVFSFFLVLFTMSSIGLPGTNGFVSEFLTILGALTSPVLGLWFGVAATLGVILGAVYMLHMVARLVFGPLRLPTDGHAHDAAHAAPDHRHAFDARGGARPKHIDLTGREIGILTPLAIAVIVLGVLPTPLLKSIAPSVEQARIPAEVHTWDRPETAGAAPPGAPGLSAIDSTQ